VRKPDLEPATPANVRQRSEKAHDFIQQATYINFYLGHGLFRVKNMQGSLPDKVYLPARLILRHLEYPHPTLLADFSMWYCHTARHIFVQADPHGARRTVSAEEE